jgi:hypothetical protein
MMFFSAIDSHKYMVPTTFQMPVTGTQYQRMYVDDVGLYRQQDGKHIRH